MPQEDDKGAVYGDHSTAIAKLSRSVVLERIEKMCMEAYAYESQEVSNMHKCMESDMRTGNMECLAECGVTRSRYQGKADAYFNLAEAVRTLRTGNRNLKGGEVGELLRYESGEWKVEPSEGGKDGADN